jgi:hypothetical protein
MARVKEAKMRHSIATGLVLGALLGSTTGVRAGEPPSGDDDLAVVKKAVATEPTPAPRIALAREGSRSEAGEARPRTTAEPRWLKVRVVESGSHKSRVTVNLPLAMVRALGDDFPIDLGSAHLRLSEVLKSLESGEPLVEVKKPDTTVRVWVE